MASIDKIYGTFYQREEFIEWCKENRPQAVKEFYDWQDEWNYDENVPITCLSEENDMWMLKNCPIGWVTDRIKSQYDMGRIWIIIKSVRVSNTPYSGPTCGRAGVKPGLFYELKQEALDDARKLSEKNAVGFKVVEWRKGG